MKKDLVVCGAQIESVTGDIDANLDKGAEWIEKCVGTYSADLVVFPETVTTGFNTGLGPEKLNSIVDEIPGKTTDKIAESARKNKTHVIWTTYEKAPGGKVYNSAVLITDKGEIAGIYRKVHPFPAEREWTTPGNSADVFTTDIGKIGIFICFDGDFAELARIMGIKGADIIARPSAFLRSFDTWSLTNRARAYDSRAHLVAVNQVGGDNSSSNYYGHSMIVTPQGHRIAQALSNEEIVHAKLTNELLNYASYGDSVPMLSDNIKLRRPEAYEGLL
ncbi:MAG: carbon-nitrogen hydrolase family protein [Elusimicrobiota bacterium]|nr:carbon-nitrogen hydrolase family protein [Elusimicrobiota bacterium]